MQLTIVTGASRGLGLAVTQALSQRGHHVPAPGIVETGLQLGRLLQHSTRITAPPAS